MIDLNINNLSFNHLEINYPYIEVKTSFYTNRSAYDVIVLIAYESNILLIRKFSREFYFHE